MENASTPIHGDERGNASECDRLLLSGPTLIPRIAPQGRGHIHRGSAEPQKEQLGHNTPDLHSAGRDSNQRGHDDRAQGAQQPPESTPERTFGGGQDDGDADDLVQSGRSRGES